MSTIVVKPDCDRDFYVGWSSIVDSPVWWGSRAEVLRYLTDEGRCVPADAPALRLARADATGTSAYNRRDGGWDDDDGGFVYEQRGWLARRHLAKVCRLLDTGDEAAVWELLEPFEDADTTADHADPGVV